MQHSRDDIKSEELIVDELDIHCLADDTRIQRYLRSARCTYSDIRGIYQKYRQPDWNPWHPFKKARDLELSRWLMDSGITNTVIHVYLQCWLHDDRCS